LKKRGIKIMNENIKALLEGLKIGRKQSHGNLAMFPVLSAYSPDIDYLLLDEALKSGVIEIAEVEKEGSVPELRVKNSSPGMILILDGEELVGAKQNRIVNTTILVRGNSTVIIPVSCVEMGRWSYSSPSFSSDEHLMSSSMRAMKSEQVRSSLRSSGNFVADQGAIWDEISEKAYRRNAESPSMAMNEIYKKDRQSVDEYISHFRMTESQTGAIFMINGKVAGIDTFGKTDTFKKIFRKLLESYALDAVDWFETGRKYENRKDKVTGFIQDALQCETDARQSVGLGTDLRMESEKITGFALALDDMILHLSLFAKANVKGKAERSSRMSRYSRRRTHRIY